MQCQGLFFKYSFTDRKFIDQVISFPYEPYPNVSSEISNIGFNKKEKQITKHQQNNMRIFIDFWLIFFIIFYGFSATSELTAFFFKKSYCPQGVFLKHSTQFSQKQTFSLPILISLVYVTLMPLHNYNNNQHKLVQKQTELIFGKPPTLVGEETQNLNWKEAGQLS